MATRVEIHREVSAPSFDNGWQLWFQSVTYHIDGGDNNQGGWTEEGFRFIWRRPDGSLQAARGQARIPDAATLELLIQNARAEGWF